MLTSVKREILPNQIIFFSIQPGQINIYINFITYFKEEI